MGNFSAGCVGAGVLRPTFYDGTIGRGIVAHSVNASSCSRSSPLWGSQVVVNEGLGVFIPINASLLPGFLHVQFSLLTVATRGVVAGTCTSGGGIRDL